MPLYTSTSGLYKKPEGATFDIPYALLCQLTPLLISARTAFNLFLAQQLKSTFGKKFDSSSKKNDAGLISSLYDTKLGGMALHVEAAASSCVVTKLGADKFQLSFPVFSDMALQSIVANSLHFPLNALEAKSAEFPDELLLKGNSFTGPYTSDGHYHLILSLLAHAAKSPNIIKGQLAELNKGFMFDISVDKPLSKTDGFDPEAFAEAVYSDLGIEEVPTYYDIYNSRIKGFKVICTPVTTGSVQSHQSTLNLVKKDGTKEAIILTGQASVDALRKRLKEFEGDPQVIEQKISIVENTLNSARLHRDFYVHVNVEVSLKEAQWLTQSESPELQDLHAVCENAAAKFQAGMTQATYMPLTKIQQLNPKTKPLVLDIWDENNITVGKDGLLYYLPEINKIEERRKFKEENFGASGYFSINDLTVLSNNSYAVGEDQATKVKRNYREEGNIVYLDKTNGILSYYDSNGMESIIDLRNFRKPSKRHYLAWSRMTLFGLQDEVEVRKRFDSFEDKIALIPLKLDKTALAFFERLRSLPLLKNAATVSGKDMLAPIKELLEGEEIDDGIEGIAV